MIDGIGLNPDPLRVVDNRVVKALILVQETDDPGQHRLDDFNEIMNYITLMQSFTVLACALRFVILQSNRTFAKIASFGYDAVEGGDFYAKEGKRSIIARLGQSAKM